MKLSIAQRMNRRRTIGQGFEAWRVKYAQRLANRGALLSLLRFNTTKHICVFVVDGMKPIVYHAITIREGNAGDGRKVERMNKEELYKFREGKDLYQHWLKNYYVEGSRLSLPKKDIHAMSKELALCQSYILDCIEFWLWN